MSTFEINLNLGNVAMATREDIAVTLREIARRLESTDETGKVILDANGNTVGNWWLVFDDEDEDEDETEYEDDGQGDDAWADAQTFESAYGPEDY